ncbi:MAG: hypothetical protein MAG795_00586 [Candidatus Woesearchaeota archaeon]|nr:hypothetical protein [Candidatus Woesearchaeota archaeon]
MGSWFVVLFYLAIILFVYLNRKKFDIQAKIVALYKTKIGTKLMKKFVKKHKNLVKIFGYSGIGFGFVGMLFISYTLLENLFKLFTIPGAQSAVTPVIPGVSIPGSPVFIPLISGWLALFIVIVVHEFSHGIVALAHKIKIKSSGILFFGPIMGAFVEPDEKKLKKASDVVKYSIFAAGPFSNMILAGLAALVVFAFLNPLTSAITQVDGFSISSVEPESPAALANLKPGMFFIKYNNEPIEDWEEMMNNFDSNKPNQKITLSTEKNDYEIITATNPEDESKAFIGISGIEPNHVLKPEYKHLAPLYPIKILSWLAELNILLILLSSGIGLANLLPLGPVDGGRMIKTAFSTKYGKGKGKTIWKNISIGCLTLLVVNLVLGILLSLI